MAYQITEFLLSERDNPNSSVRANGRRFWGYPTRNGGLNAIQGIGVHTTENDLTDSTAMNVARWQASTAPNPSSYHALADSATIVRTLKDEAVAFHIVGFNTGFLGLSFGTRASAWGRNPQRDMEALKRGAWVAARWCKAYGIPVRWLSRGQAQGGSKGFLRHSTADPSRRSDPGSNFPAGEFFALIQNYLDDSTSTQPDPDPNSFEGFFMQLSKQEQEDIRNMARAFRSTDEPISGHQAGTFLRRNVPAQGDAGFNPDRDYKFSADMRKSIERDGGTANTANNTAEFLRELSDASGRPGNNPRGIARWVLNKLS